MDTSRIDLLLNASQEKISAIPGLTENKFNGLNRTSKESTVVNPFSTDTSVVGLAQAQNQIPTNTNIRNGIDRTPMAGLFEIDRSSMDLSPKVAEEGAKLYDQQNVNPLTNTLKAAGSGILDVGSSVLRSPEKLYKTLGGDYLEKGSAFEQAQPTYTKAVKSTMDWMSKGANAIDELNKQGIGYDNYKAQQLQADVGRSFDEGNYVSGIFKSMADNPVAAVELAANMYGFSKAMSSKGFTGLPAIVGSFTDSADQAKTLFVKEHGREPNKEELGAILGLSAVSTAIDTAASKYLLGGAEGGKFATNLTKSVDDLVSKIPSSVARVALGTSSKIGAMMATEGLQEGSQQALIDLAGTQDVSKLGEDKYLKDIYMNAALGAIAGPGMAAMNTTEAIAPLLAQGAKSTYSDYKNFRDELKNSTIVKQPAEMKPVTGATPTPASVQTPQIQRSPDEMLKAFDEAEAYMQTTGELDQHKDELAANRQQWTDIKNAVDSEEMYNAMKQEVGKSEDLDRKTYLNAVLKKADSFLGKSKTLFDAVEGTPNEGVYVAADNIVRGTGVEWEPNLAKPLDIADTIQAIQTIREMRNDYNIGVKDTTKEDVVYNKAVDAVKGVLSQQLQQYANFDKMSADEKIGIIGDELYGWLKQHAPSEDVNEYMKSMLYPVVDAMAESRTFGSGPVDKPMMYKGINVDAEIRETPSVNVKDQQAKTKAKVEAKLYADANLQVDETVTDTHTGVSKGSINKLAETFKVPAGKVKSALDIAFQRMQIKKMADVSKESNKAQYEIYHGKDGILPNFVKYKAAAEKGDNETASKAVNNLVKRYVDQLYKYSIAIDSIKPVQDKIKALGKDVTLEQLKEAVGGVKVTIQGATGSDPEYTINGMSIAKMTDSVSEDIQDQITMGTGGNILEAIKESVLHLQEMFNREELGELLPKISVKKVLRDDIYNSLVDKIAVLIDKRDKLSKKDLDPSVKRTSEELDRMADATKELAKVEQELAKRIAEQQKVFRNRSGNIYQYNNTTFKEDVSVSGKMGQEVGTVTEAEAARLGLDLEVGQIKDYEPLKSADEYKQILDKIAELKKEKADVNVELNTAVHDIAEQRKQRKVLLDKLHILEQELDGEAKTAVEMARVNADTIDKTVTKLANELVKAKARASELKTANMYLEKNKEVFENANVNAEQLVKLQAEYGRWMNGIINKSGKVPSAKERNDKLRELVKGTNLLETIVTDLSKVAKIGVILARKLMGMYTYDKPLTVAVNKELVAVAKQVEDLQAQLVLAKAEQKAIVRDSRIQIVQALRERGISPDMDVKAIENALMNSTRLKALRNKMAKPKKMSEERLKEIHKEIQELERTLKGSRLYKSNIASNMDLVEGLRKSGIDIEAPLDMNKLKVRGSMLGTMTFDELITLMPKDNEAQMYLDKVDAEASKGMKKLYNGSVGVKLLGKLVSQNPALMLIAKIDKLEDKNAYALNYDKNMLNTLMLAVENYIAINGSDLAMNTKLDVSKIIGVGEYDPKVNQVYHQIMGIGKLHTTIASRIGDDFVQALGVSQGEMGTEQYRKLVADLGNTGLILAKANGLLDEPRMTAVQWNTVAGESSKIPEGSDVQVKFIKLKAGNATSVKVRAHNSTILKRMNETLDSLDEQSTYRTHRVNAVKNKKAYEIDGSPFAIPEDSQEVMRHLEDQVYVVQESALKKLVEAYRDDKTRALVMEKAGWQDLESMDNALQDDKDAQQSVNREIEDTLAKLDEMEAMYTLGGITPDVYFNWFFTSNGRYMIDSIGINPQADKHFSRFLIVPEQSHNREWNINDEVDKMLMHDGIAQAFGHDIDKSTGAETEAFAEGVIKQFKGDKEFEAKVMSGEIEVPHFGHALQAIEFMRSMKTNGRFTGTLVVEYDAKTSGPMHKLMQAPILDDGTFGAITKEWLNKGAILVDGDFSESSAAHVGTLEDGYQTITKEADKQLPEQVPVRVSNDRVVVDYKKLFSELNGLLDKLVTKGTVTKQGRTLGKSAFVPFGYAASTESIKRNIGETLAYDILKKIVDPAYGAHETIMNALGMNKRAYAQLQSDLRSKPANEVRVKIPDGTITSKREILGLLGEMFTMTYGEAYKAAMVSIFQPQVAMNNAIKDTTSVMFRMWKIKYDEMLAKEPNVTADRKMEVVRELEDYFPLIKAPWSKNKQDGIAIFDTKRSSMRDEELPTVNTTTNVDGELSSETVQAMITEMEETFAAGAVLPIHWIDGTQIASVLMRGGITGVHDAIVTGMKGSTTQQTIKDMNQAMYDVNKNYNMFDEFQLTLLNMLDKVDDKTLNAFLEQEEAKGDKALDLASVKARVDTIAENIRVARTQLYGNAVTVGNIIAFKDTEYKGTNTDIVNVNKNEIAIKGLLKKLAGKMEQIEAQINEGASKAVAEEGIEKLIESKKVKVNPQAENVPGAMVQPIAASMLKVVDGKFMFVSGKARAVVNNVNELVAFANEYNSLMIGEGKVANITDAEQVNNMFVTLNKIGIPFKPLTINITPSTTIKGGERGRYDVKGHVIHMYYNEVHKGANPAQVVLHEYVHAITMDNLDRNPEVKKKVTALMEHVKNARPDMKVYGMTNEAEFLAEAIAEPRFQKALSEIPSYKGTGILEHIKNLFKELLNSLSKKEIKEANALTDALELVVETANIQEVVFDMSAATKGKAKLSDAIIDATICK